MEAQENLYRPPQAAVEVPQESRGGSFYVVSTKKFLVLYLATFGVYQWYWFYKHWAMYRKSSGENIWPVARAFFAIFYVYSLFQKFDEEVRARASAVDWSFGGLAGLYIVLSFTSQIVDRLATRGVLDERLGLVTILALPVLAWCLYKAQIVANAASGDPEGSENDRFTLANSIWIFFGAILWAMVLLGIYDTLVGLPV